MSFVLWLNEINWISVTLLSLAALAWGGSPERLSVATFAFMLIADTYYHLLIGPHSAYTAVDLGHLTIDVVAAIQFATVALYANRVYPLWLTAFQIVSVFAHFARMEMANIGLLAYALLNYGPYYFELAILILGIGSHRAREHKHGVYPAWRI